MADITQGGTPVVGDTATGVTDSGRPVKIGGKTANGLPGLSGIGNRIDAMFDRYGRMVVINGAPHPLAPITVTATATGTTSVKPGSSGLNIVVYKMNIMNSGSAAHALTLESSGTVRWRGTLAGGGGGANLDFGSSGWILPASNALEVNLTTASGSINVNVLEHTII